MAGNGGYNKVKKIFEQKEALLAAAAEEIITTANQAVEERGRFTWVLSGGNTPKDLYRLLTTSPYKDKMPWQQSYFFWGDERLVKPDHEHSNYGMARHCLLDKKELGIKQDRIFPMVKDHLDSDKAAAEYEEVLKKFFRLNQQAHWPVFDFVLLGMGDDGHTLSLFPGDDAHCQAYRRLVVSVFAPTGNPPGHRISLTFPVINKAGKVMFLVTGENKRAVLRSIWTNQERAKKHYPAACVEPEGRLIWMTDKAAGDIDQY